SVPPAARPRRPPGSRAHRRRAATGVPRAPRTRPTGVPPDGSTVTLTRWPDDTRWEPNHDPIPRRDRPGPGAGRGRRGGRLRDREVRELAPLARAGRQRHRPEGRPAAVLGSDEERPLEGGAA